jgi:hypothetical protein
LGRHPFEHDHGYHDHSSFEDLIYQKQQGDWTPWSK